MAEQLQGVARKELRVRYYEPWVSRGAQVGWSCGSFSVPAGTVITYTKLYATPPGADVYPEHRVTVDGRPGWLGMAQLPGSEWVAKLEEEVASDAGDDQRP